MNDILLLEPRNEIVKNVFLFAYVAIIATVLWGPVVWNVARLTWRDRGLQISWAVLVAAAIGYLNLAEGKPLPLNFNDTQLLIGIALLSFLAAGMLAGLAAATGASRFVVLYEAFYWSLVLYCAVAGNPWLAGGIAALRMRRYWRGGATTAAATQHLAPADTLGFRANPRP